MSIPLNIIKHSKNIDDFDTNEYLFQLTLQFKDGTFKEYIKVDTKNYTTLFQFSDLIEYNNIRSFSLVITKMLLANENFTLNDNLNNNKKIYKNNDIYLEFLNNKTNHTKCLCTLNAMNTTRLFFTPPNY